MSRLAKPTEIKNKLVVAIEQEKKAMGNDCY
jgi:hypothetical protein